MVNFQENRRELVDTLAITMVAVYLAQLHRNWGIMWGAGIQKALDFIRSRVYEHEIEGFKLWHFNGFYAPDWEDTSFAVFLLMKNGLLKIAQLESLRALLLNNTTQQGTGIWVKDPYSSDNAQNNHWDPTSGLNILRLHYLLESDKLKRRRVEAFIQQNLTLERFWGATLYYTPPVAAFFARRLAEDFPVSTDAIAPALLSFHQAVVKAISRGYLDATPFEKTLVGLPTGENDDGLIFHHGRRTVIWYGSPTLHTLARIVLE